MLIDTHCHLTHGKLLTRAEAVLQEARAAGVAAVLSAASDIADARAAVGLAKRHEAVYCSVGVHPHEAKDVEPHYLRQLREIASAGGESCVAVGEIGLDYHYDFSPRDAQQAVFEAQLDLAAELDMPIIVHTREATDDTLAMLAPRAGALSGVIHSFTGGPGEARQFLDQGWFISFSGIVTFKRSDDNREAARLVPADRILVETDAPYLSPEPVRKAFPNMPAHVAHTAALLAKLRGLSPEAFAEQTTANACALFGMALT